MPLRYCFLGYVFLYFFRNNNENIFVWIVLNNLFFRTKKNISFNFTINRNKRKNTKWPQSFRTLFNSLDSEVWTDSTRLARLISQTSQLRRRRINGHLKCLTWFQILSKKKCSFIYAGEKITQMMRGWILTLEAMVLGSTRMSYSTQQVYESSWVFKHWS